MATLFKPTRPYPLPANAAIVSVECKPHVEMKEGRKVVRYPLSEDGTHYLKPAKKWAADVRHANGKRKRVRFSPNHDAAALMLSELLKKIENEKAGVIDRTTEHRKRPLTAHLEDWLTGLRANGREAGYVALKASRVRAAVEGCGWVFPGDMTADRLETFLADLRNRRPDLPPISDGVELFTMRQLCGLLGGVSRHTVATLIRRNRLSGTGRGKKRRFPRETVNALRGLKDHGCCSQTSNHYLQAVRQFGRWLADNGRIDRTPFARLKPMNVRLDQRRRRGELTPIELVALFTAAGTSGISVRGLAGPDRVMLYRVAVGTGFRAAELAALVPEFFDLAATTPAVVLPAEFTKNRKGVVQPLGASLATDLRTYLAGRPGKIPIWPGAWVGKAADMLRADLDAAGVPVEVDSPEGIETRDFHALRAVFISDVIRAGADLKQAMTLARHTDPRLTAGRYARTRLHDLGGLVDRLPNTTGPTTEKAALQMTGTDAGGPIREQQGAAPGAAAGGVGRLRLRTCEEVSSSEGGEQTPSEAHEMQANGEDRGESGTEDERGLARIRTGDSGFANRCLTTWLRGHSTLRSGKW